MADALDLFYWDTNLFYEQLKEENVDSHLRQGRLNVLAENEERRNRICTSAVTHIEVVPKKLPGEKEAAYWRSFNSMYFFDIPVDANIVKLAREIKNFYYKEADEDGKYRMMSTPDAIHLATAIIHGVTEFHTRDKNAKHGNVKLLGLPEMSPGGKICGIYDLKIVSPTATQGNLWDAISPDKQDEEPK